MINLVYEAFTRAKTLPRYITAKEDILAVGKDLFLREFPLKLRLIGLRMSTLKDLRPHPGGIEKVTLTLGILHRSTHPKLKSISSLGKDMNDKHRNDRYEKTMKMTMATS